LENYAGVKIAVLALAIDYEHRPEEGQDYVRGYEKI